MLEKRQVKTTALRTLHLLQEAEKLLKSARNWGYYDLVGGGFFTSIIKRSRVKKAEALVQRIQDNLKELQGQLGGRGLGPQPTIDISSFQWFTDIALDNMIFDWFTQSKIQDSLRRIQAVSAKVEEIIGTLE